jgi:hypothetical protein
MKSSIWISYDLGVKGDYESLYEWLDDHEARECGDSVAFILFEHGNSPVETVVKREIGEAINVDKQTRIYIVFHDGKKQLKGRFIIGKRKAAAWSGYGSSSPAEDDEDES